MQKDEIGLLRQRIKLKGEKLKKAEEEKDIKTANILSPELALLKLELRYLESGGKTLEAPDDLAQLDFLLREKRTLLEDFKKSNLLPPDHIQFPKYLKIESILKAQCEYLSAKRAIISENRHIEELARWIQFAEKEGVAIVGSPIEHEAEVKRFKPVKLEKEKKEFVIEFKKIALVIAIVLIILAVYFGTFWRKTPYDKDIIRSYVVARNHYLSANDYYVAGDYENSKKEYAIAAAFFNRAESGADLAAKSHQGIKMHRYFDYKKRFFEQWELISLKMVESSQGFQSGNYDLGAMHAEEAVGMAEVAGRYNREAEEAWRIL